MWRTSRLLLAAAGLLALTGCSQGSPVSSLTGELVCARPDVADRYLPLVSGDFTRDNLAELAREPDRRARLLEDAGFVGGSFSYWKEVVEDTGSGRPANVLCEALEFASPEGADAYLRSIDPVRDGDLPGLTWTGSRPTDVEELRAGEAGRALRMSAPGDANSSLVALYRREGSHVVAIYVGGGSNDQEEQARAIQARLLERVTPVLAREVATSRSSR